jgi:cell filamentation protein, protein adenylyltransferase
MSDPYLIPGTGTLRNRLGITDAEALIRAEADLTVARMVQLEEGLYVPGQWDLDHLRAFHRHIFQDIYDWAGEIRTVDISKSDHVFARLQFIEAAATNLFAELAGTDHLRGRDRASFVEGVTHLLGEINALHPFREGNGRAQRAFVGALAAQAGYEIDWRSVEPERNIAVSAASFGGDDEPMRQMLDELISERHDR